MRPNPYGHCTSVRAIPSNPLRPIRCDALRSAPIPIQYGLSFSMLTSQPPPVLPALFPAVPYITYLYGRFCPIHPDRCNALRSITAGAVRCLSLHCATKLSCTANPVLCSALHNLPNRTLALRPIGCAARGDRPLAALCTLRPIHAARARTRSSAPAEPAGPAARWGQPQTHPNQRRCPSWNWRDLPQSHSARRP